MLSYLQFLCQQRKYEDLHETTQFCVCAVGPNLYANHYSVGRFRCRMNLMQHCLTGYDFDTDPSLQPLISSKVLFPDWVLNWWHPIGWEPIDGRGFLLPCLSMLTLPALNVSDWCLWIKFLKIMIKNVLEMPKTMIVKKYIWGKKLTPAQNLTSFYILQTL